MRWILVFIFLYLIPLVILFRNYKNKKRSLVYSSIYVVLMTLIVICNIYMSGLKRIEESMDKYRAVQVQVDNNGSLIYTDEDNIDNYEDNNREVYKKYKLKEDDSLESDDFNDEIEDDLDDDSEESSKFTVNTDNNTVGEYSKNKLDKSSSDSNPEEHSNIDKSDEKSNSPKESNMDYKDIEIKETSKLNDPKKQKLEKERQSDLDKIDSFRKEVFSAEKTALKSMQKCLHYTKNVAGSLSNIKKVNKDITTARDECKDLAQLYKEMETPKLSKSKYEKELKNAKLYMQKTYELRAKSMDNAIKLVDSKNPKYISKVTDYLDSSDKKVKQFSQKVNDLKKEIEDK